MIANRWENGEGKPAGFEGQLNDKTHPLVQVVGAARSLGVTLELEIGRAHV